MIKLYFCQNDLLMGESFWQNNSLVTQILLNYAQFDILTQSQILWLTLYVFMNEVLCESWKSMEYNNMVNEVTESQLHKVN